MDHKRVTPHTNPESLLQSDFDADAWEALLQAMLTEYRKRHKMPWIVGFSGGKDSTVLLQAVVEMLLLLPRSERRRRVYVVCNDTMVESPIYAAFVLRTLDRLRNAFDALMLDKCMEVIVTRPALSDTFWANLIGRGYRAPTRHMRWCTDRMKIRPTGKVIADLTQGSGGSILLLGVRRDESAQRAKSIAKHDAATVDALNPHGSVRDCWVYRPIVDMTNSDVWTVLLQRRPPWGGNHRDLVTLYKNATGECPFVVDADDAPSCGESGSARMGCWTCTVVEKDKSLQAFIDAGFEHLEPLVDFRGWIAELSEDYSKRYPVRRNGETGIGPFTMEVRREILERLLATQREVGVELISPDEVSEIHRIWRDDALTWAAGIVNVLHDIRGEEPVLYELSTGKKTAGVRFVPQKK